MPETSELGEDLLSSLPDDFLINNILSRLPMLEAQRTTLLSRRWRYLCLYVPCLDLDGSHIVPNNPFIVDKISAASKYVRWVDQTIGAYRGTTALRHFRVRFCLGDRYARKVYSWLAFSLKQGVEALELDCSCTRTLGWYTSRSVELSWFPNIRLLKSLNLRNVYMPDDSLKDLLSACELLERLDLAHVDALTRVNVTGPVSTLKHIHIHRCYGVKSVMIRAPTPDLVSFIYPLKIEKITLKHAPLLVDLRLRVFSNSTVHPLFRYLSQLEVLHLAYFPCDEKIDPLHGFPVLSRLKHLKMEFDGSDGPEFFSKKLCCLASLLEEVPGLQRLTVEVGLGRLGRFVFPGELANMRQLPVRVIEIAGFSVFGDADRELALHLIRASPSLEKLIIDQRNTILRERVLGRYIYSEKEKGRKHWEKRVKDVFEPELPSKAKLVLI